MFKGRDCVPDGALRGSRCGFGAGPGSGGGGIWRDGGGGGGGGGRKTAICVAWGASAIESDVIDGFVVCSIDTFMKKAHIVRKVTNFIGSIFCCLLTAQMSSGRAVPVLGTVWNCL